MEASDWIALAAAVIALAALVLRFVDKRESRHASVMTALQGDKEAVGYEAYRLGEEGWPKPGKRRSDLRDALYLAFVFESSDRTRALIHRALKSYPPDDRAELVETLKKLTATFKEAQALGSDWRLYRGWKRLRMLAMMLDVPELADEATRQLAASNAEKDNSHVR